MDFSKTKLYQRTRSGCDKFYLENYGKKNNRRRRNDGGGGGDGGGSVREIDGDRLAARVAGDDSKEKCSKKSSKVLRGSKGGKREINPVASRTRMALSGKKKLGVVSEKGNNSKQVHLIVDSDDDDDDGGLQNRIISGTEEVSEIEKIEETRQTDPSRKRGKISAKGVSGTGKSKKEQKSSRTIDFQQNSAPADDDDDDDEDALSHLGEKDHGSGNSEKELETGFVNNDAASNGDCLKGKGGFDDEFDKDAKDSSLSSRGFPLSPGFQLCESDAELGDDATCLDDYDRSHSSRVESNEVKVGPVELDSVQAYADGKVQGVKSPEEEDDPQKLVSPEEDGTDSLDEEPIENNAAARDKEVISLSSSDSEVGEINRNAMGDDDGSSVLEVENDDDLDDMFWELLQKHTLDAGHENNNGCERCVFNPKPVCKPRAPETVVSKKRNETWKPVERRSKKRRINAESSLGYARNKNKGVKDTFWQVVDEKVDEKSTQNDETGRFKKYDRFGNKINVMEILTDAMQEEGNGDNVLKRYVDIPPEVIPTEETPVDLVEEVLSYKFKFEDTEDIKPEKSESEMEVDGLFDEMNVCLQISEIGSSDTRGVRCGGDSVSLVDGVNQSTRCRRGNHQLLIDDQVGIICRYCSYVEMEVRDILPPLGKNGRGGHGRHDHDRLYTDKLSDLKFTDLHQERHHDSQGGEYENGTVWDLVPGVRDSMYPHQREGFEFIWTKIAGGTYINKLEKQLPTGGSGCIISHAPGTGKSRLTIVFLQSLLKMYPTSRPVIIAPRSMLLTWEEEFKKWNADFPFFNLNNTECSGKEHKVAVSLLRKSGRIKSLRGIRLLKLLSWKTTPSVLGVTYRLFENLAGEEGKRKKTASNVVDEQMKNFLLKVPTLLVLDEGHTPRNDQSHMWKTLLNVKTKRSIILSGTPFQNNFDELYNTLCLVNPLLSFGISSLNKRGWKHTATKGEWDSLTSSVKKSQRKLQELKAVIDPFVHVHKGTILQERLPGLRDALVVLKPTRTQQTLLNKMAGLKLSLENDHIMSLVSVHPSLLPQTSYNIGGLHKVLKVFENDPSAGVKTSFLMELIQLSGAHNEKVLVFSQYIKPLEFIMQLLKTYFGWVEGRECLYMDGQQEEKHRQNSINSLNDPKSEVKVLLASLKACSEGINLVGASRVVLLDVHWNPSVERQAISRAYRLGQKKLVHVYHLVTGSMEGEKYIRQVEKSHLSELVFSSKNKDSSNPTISSTVSKDKILEEMVHHERLRNMFEKVIYQPKEADLINTFG